MGNLSTVLICTSQKDNTAYAKHPSFIENVFTILDDYFSVYIYAHKTFKAKLKFNFCYILFSLKDQEKNI